MNRGLNTSTAYKVRRVLSHVSRPVFLAAILFVALWALSLPSKPLALAYVLGSFAALYLGGRVYDKIFCIEKECRSCRLSSTYEPDGAERLFCQYCGESFEAGFAKIPANQEDLQKKLRRRQWVYCVWILSPIAVGLSILVAWMSGVLSWDYTLYIFLFSAFIGPVLGATVASLIWHECPRCQAPDVTEAQFKRRGGPILIAQNHCYHCGCKIGSQRYI